MLLTDIAGKRPLACVGNLVTGEVEEIDKHFATLQALMTLACCVNKKVTSEAFPIRKSLPTHVTDEGSLPSVDSLVVLQRRGTAQDPPAHLTLVLVSVVLARLALGRLVLLRLVLVRLVPARLIVTLLARFLVNLCGTI